MQFLHPGHATCRVAELAPRVAVQGHRFQAQAGRRVRQLPQQPGLLVEQRRGLAIVPEAEPQARHHAVEFRARLRLPGEAAIAAHDAHLEQAAKVHRRVHRRIARALEQVGDEALHRLRATGFAQGLPCLPTDHAERHEHHQQHHAGGGERPAMAVGVLARAVGQAFAARQHRLTTQVAPQVLRERLGGHVALLRALAQGFQHDVVEVARQLARQPRRRIRPRRFDLAAPAGL